MTGTADHLEPEWIADLQEGLLDGERAAQARAHLAGCDRCQAEAAALLDVRARLGSVAVDPMPDDVAARLDALLAGAARADAVRPDRGRAIGAQVTPLHPRRPQHRPSSGGRLLAAAAVVVLLLGGGALAVSLLRGSGGNTTTSARTAGKATSGADEAAGRYPVLSSGTDYTARTLAAAVPRLLSSPVTAPSARAQTPSTGPRSGADGRRSGGASPAAPEAFAGRLAGGPALADCLVELTGSSGSQPLAVDIATFDGKPATVILLPTPDDPAKVDVQVVGPACRQGDAALLNFTRVALP